MKLSIFAVLAILAAVCSAAQISNIDAIKKDLKDLEPLIPKTRIILIAAKHLIFDKEFRKAKKFFGTPKSSELFVEIMKSKPFRRMVSRLQYEGIEAKEIINELAKVLKIPAYPKNFDTDEIIESRTLGTFLHDVVAALPKQKIGALMKKKINANRHYRKLYHTGISGQFNKEINDILTYPPLATAFATFKSNGIDFKEIHNTVNTILSWAK